MVGQLLCQFLPTMAFGCFKIFLLISELKFYFALIDAERSPKVETITV